MIHTGVNTSYVPIAATFSKDPVFWGRGAVPPYLIEGNGCRVKGANGKWYIDWVSGLGATLLGYGQGAERTAFTSHINMYVQRGNGFSLPHELEYRVAERLVKKVGWSVPGWDQQPLQVRWVKTGSDACEAAVRLARAITGKGLLLSCYDKDTEILTEDGFVLFSDLRKGHAVATLNPDTHLVEYRIPYNYFKYRYRGNLIGFHGQSTDLAVTPDHMLYVGLEQKDGCRKYDFRSASTYALRKGKGTRLTPIYMMRSSSGWTGNDLKTIVIPRVHSSAHTKGIIEFDAKLFMKLLGWFISEGSLSAKDHRKRRKRWMISLAQFDGPVRDDMVSTIAKLGFAPFVNGHHVNFNSKELWVWLRPLGHSCDKHVPKEIKTLSPNLLSILLDAMIDGDGSRHASGKWHKLYTTSRQLVDDTQEILLKLGWSSTVSKQIGVGYSKQSIVYHISMSGKKEKACKVGNITEIPYDDYVYDVTVDNHIIMVRRNGKTVWSGNCGYHGYHSEFVASTPPAWGVVGTMRDSIRTFDFNSITSLEEVAGQDDIAAVIIEQSLESPLSGYYDRVREFCDTHGALLIMDEVITGLRYGLGGACERFDIHPDIICMGKSLGNGYPIAAVIAPTEYMNWFTRNDPVFISSTNAGDVISLAAADYILDHWTDTSVAHIHKVGSELFSGLVAAGWTVKGNAEYSLLQFDFGAQRAYFIAAMAARGFLINRPNFPNLSHTIPDAQATSAAALCVREEMPSNFLAWRTREPKVLFDSR